MQLCSFAVCCPRVAITVITAKPAYSHEGNLQEWPTNNFKNTGVIEDGHKQKLDRVGRKNERRRGNRGRQK